MELLRGRYRDMETRIQLAPKRIKQYNQYTRILEDRITLLEERCAAYDQKMLKTNGVIPPPDPSLGSRPSSTLDTALGFKFWEDFENTASPLNIIDVLVGDPKVTRAEKMRRQKGPVNTMNQGEEDLMDSLVLILPTAKAAQQSEKRDLVQEVARLKGKQLPERIRFNVSSIPRLFFKSCGGELFDDICSVHSSLCSARLKRYKMSCRRFKTLWKS
jgi:hypothetical protein